MRELERAIPEPTTATPALTLVGHGRLGGAIARTASAAGMTVSIADRADLSAACSGAETLLLCVPDSAIADLASALSDLDDPPRRVGHTSGSSDLGALEALTGRGVPAFSLHPLQTVPDAQADLTGAPCAVSGSDPATTAFAAGLASALGMDPFDVPDGTRAAYHAAASIASNFLIALEESAVQVLDAAGVAGGRRLLTPLVLQTARNWSERGAEALTGPIVRGDELTVDRHRAALRELAPDVLGMYDAMAERTRKVPA